MSQALTFDKVVRQLYFNAGISTLDSAVVDSLKAVSKLKYLPPTSRQWSLNISMELNADEKAFASAHIFTFTESPIPNLKIKEGQIVVRMGATKTLKKLIGLDWMVEFATHKDALLFFDYLQQTFEPLATKHKSERNSPVEKTIQFSTRKPEAQGIKDIAFSLYKSLKTHKYQIALSLMNEFVEE